MSKSIQVAVAHGDGIGPEVMEAVIRILRGAGVLDHLDLRNVEMGLSAYSAGFPTGISSAAMYTMAECGLLLKGPMETPKGKGGKSINVTLRKIFSAAANIRPVAVLPGVPTRLKFDPNNPFRLVIVRENIEDTYGGIEHRLSAGTMLCRRLITEQGSLAIHRKAFEIAAQYGLRRVHCGHKANIMKMTDGLFLETFKRAAAEHPDIEAGDVIVDALCMNLVMRPEHYGVIVLPNFQGDIVSDLCAGLIGGLGFAPSANIGTSSAIFEAVHGSAPDIAGKGIANPTALLLSALMLLRHVGLLHHAALIENALLRALEEGVHTGDFGERSTASSTSEFADAIIARLGQGPQSSPPVPVPAFSEPTFVRPTPPTEPTMLLSGYTPEEEITGSDLFIDTTQTPMALAGVLEKVISGTSFRLEFISNRGTVVYPNPNPLTECTDSYRARFIAREGVPLTQADCIALLSLVASELTVSSYELLRNFDGQPGFSKAQGQKG